MSERGTRHQAPGTKLRSFALRAQDDGGFTLIELMTAMALSALVVLALGSALLGSGKIFRFIQARGDAALENSLIALERIRKEAQESPVYPSIPFEGNASEVSFPQPAPFEGTALDAEFVLGQSQTAALGSVFVFRKVRYRFDASRKALVREAPPEPERVLVENLENAAFSYAVGSLREPLTEWSDKTPAQGSAQTVRALGVRLEFERKPYGYTIPAVEKTFLLYRRHPLNAIWEGHQTPEHQAPVRN